MYDSKIHVEIPHWLLNEILGSSVLIQGTQTKGGGTFKIISICVIEELTLKYNNTVLFQMEFQGSLNQDRIGGVMVSVVASSAVDREIEHRSGQTNDYETGICCLSTKHEVLRRKSKDWLTRNQDNVGRHVYPWTVVSVR